MLSRSFVAASALALTTLFALRAAAQPYDSGAVPSGSSGATRKAERAEPEPERVAPKLMHFESAPYPEEAQRQGLSGDVVLALSVDAAGNVTASEVVEGLGHGFDEAARQATLEFRFEPATYGGQPVPARILYRYSFTLAPEQTQAPESAPAAPTSGTLEGYLRIAGVAEETPLAGGQVVIVGPKGEQRITTTDPTGRWALPDLPPGKYRISVTAQGFEPLEMVEEVVAGEATEIRVGMSPEVESGGIVVVVEGERPPREVTRRKLERREIERIPGTGGDALRSILSLPGVARPPAFAGLLIVRGSAPQDTEAFVDGTPLPLLYHFGGLSSVVPTELLERIDFYPGNFGVQFGRLMGGVVDVGLRAPETRCYKEYGSFSEEQGCFHGLVQADLIDTRVLFEGPIGETGWSFVVAGRRSWVDTWLKPVLEEAGAGVTSAPVYYDYQVIAETKPSSDSRLSLRFYGADDRLEILIRDPAAEDPSFGGTIAFSTGFSRLQALYTGALSSDVELTSNTTFGYDSLDFSLSTFLFRFGVYFINARNEFGWTLTPGVKLNTGMDFQIGFFNARVRAPPPPRPGEPNPGPFASRPLQDRELDATAFRPAWYADLELQPTSRLRVVPGVRLDHARDTGHTDFSPRVVARYDLVAAHDPDDAEGTEPRRLRTTLKGGLGVFHQPPEFQETDEVFGTPGLESNRALHYSLGVEQEFSAEIELGVEGFYKDMIGLVSRAPDARGGFAYENQGEGSVIGLESQLKYKPDERFFGWAAYTLSRSVRKDGPAQPERLFEYDQTHNFTILGSYRLGRGWEFGARFRVVSGSLATSVVGPPSLPALYAADSGSYVPLQGEPFNRRLPLFHQLDVRIDKRWQFKSWRLSAYLDVQNAYNNQAVEGLVYNYDFSQELYQTGLPVIPSIGLRGEF